MTGEQRLKDFTKANYKKTLTKVNDHIYHFLGYGHSNAIAVLGETSVILIDALEEDRLPDKKEELNCVMIYRHSCSAVNENGDSAQGEKF